MLDARAIDARTKGPVAGPSLAASNCMFKSLLADRIELYLQGLRESRELADTHRDTDSVDVLTQIITDFEKNAWFLRASLES